MVGGREKAVVDVEVGPVGRVGNPEGLSRLSTGLFFGVKRGLKGMPKDRRRGRPRLGMSMEFLESLTSFSDQRRGAGAPPGRLRVG